MSLETNCSIVNITFHVIISISVLTGVRLYLLKTCIFFKADGSCRPQVNDIKKEKQSKEDFTSAVVEEDYCWFVCEKPSIESKNNS